jgi:peroxiredoxin
MGGGGLYAGIKMRERADAKAAFGPEIALPAKLAPGASFPDVQVLDSTGASRSTHALLRERGGVVIFIDTECEPCSVMTHRHQAAIDDGALAADQVLGITLVGPETIAAYRAAKGLTFPIFSDPNFVFGRDYGVANFPLRLVVGRSLAILDATYDSRLAVDPNRLRRQFEQ